MGRVSLHWRKRPAIHRQSNGLLSHCNDPARRGIVACFHAVGPVVPGDFLASDGLSVDPPPPEATITIAQPLFPQSPRPGQPRAMGRAFVSCKRRDGFSVLDRMRQQGSSKILFPGVPDSALTGIMLNTAGGVTGGDEFETSARVSAQCHMILTTQAAERVYRAQPGEHASITNQLWVGAGARMDWLPQETLVYDRSALRRSLEIDVAGDATLLAVEPVVFGRREMGEVLNDVTFHDRIDVRRDNQPVFADRTRLDGNAAHMLGNAALGSGCGAMASVLLVCPGAERFVAPARALMPPTGGVSLIRDGVLFARILAQDGYALRQSLVPLIELLGAGPVPRTWIL